MVQQDGAFGEGFGLVSNESRHCVPVTWGGCFGLAPVSGDTLQHRCKQGCPLPAPTVANHRNPGTVGSSGDVDPWTGDKVGKSCSLVLLGLKLSSQ